MYVCFVNYTHILTYLMVILTLIPDILKWWINIIIIIMNQKEMKLIKHNENENNDDDDMKNAKSNNIK